MVFIRGAGKFDRAEGSVIVPLFLSLTNFGYLAVRIKDMSKQHTEQEHEKLLALGRAGDYH